MTATPTTGVDVIRDALRVRNKRTNLATLARDIGISSSELDSFLTNRLKLAPTILHKLTAYLFGGNAEYDATLDRLRSTGSKIDAVPMGSPPPKLDPKSLPVYRAGPPKLAPGMVEPAKPKQPRPGWVE